MVENGAILMKLGFWDLFVRLDERRRKFTNEGARFDEKEDARSANLRRNVLGQPE